MFVELLQITNDSEKLIEKIGRICYKSEDKIKKDSYKNFIKGLISNGHESVLEHAIVTFKISGISRTCSHQLVRHRIASYTQKSQRYVNEENFTHVVPNSIVENKDVFNKFNDTIRKITSTYKELLNFGIKSEDIRYLLPNACTTEIIVTMNFRSLRNFLNERLSSGAQLEIKELSKIILKIMKKEAPIIFEDIK